MDIFKAMESRHSVRAYTDRAIEGETEAALRELLDECNRQSGLNFQLCLNEATAFAGRLARYGKFRQANNYLVLAGKPGPKFEEKCGYYGEKFVLEATRLGLNSCWVGLSYSKAACPCKLEPGEKVLCVIALGYGENQGQPSKNKPLEKLYKAQGEIPDWFRRGVEAARLAPTALNQQKFRFLLLGQNRVKAETSFGFYAKTDLGIAKYHFEMGAGDSGWQWED